MKNECNICNKTIVIFDDGRPIVKLPYPNKIGRDYYLWRCYSCSPRGYKRTEEDFVFLVESMYKELGKGVIVKKIEECCVDEVAQV